MSPIRHLPLPSRAVPGPRLEPLRRRSGTEPARLPAHPEPGEAGHYGVTDGANAGFDWPARAQPVREQAAAVGNRMLILVPIRPIFACIEERCGALPDLCAASSRISAAVGPSEGLARIGWAGRGIGVASERCWVYARVTGENSRSDTCRDEAMSEFIPITKIGLEGLKAELKRLLSEERPAVKKGRVHVARLYALFDFSVAPIARDDSANQLAD